MTHLRNLKALEDEIRALAARAVAALPKGSYARDLCVRRVRNPVNYMRRAEFASIIDRLNPPPGWRVLDAGGPQWLSICLAARHPHTSFDYVNIFPEELDPFAEIARTLAVSNLSFSLQDLRATSFDTDTFDLAYSISVLEHVEPEAGGDVLALDELSRILKRGACFCLTVPCKETARIVRRATPSGGTAAESHENFYAREYDLASIQRTVGQTAFRVIESLPIVERPGLFAKDYWEWGPGRGTVAGRSYSKAMSALEKRIDLPLERWLAYRYLRVGGSEDGRVVNVAIVSSNEK